MSMDPNSTSVSPPVGDGYVGSYTPRRLFVWDGTGSPALPSAGGDVDGIALNAGDVVGGVQYSGVIWLALPGLPALVEAAAAFAFGANLATDATGRVRAAAAGEKVVMRALQSASGAGAIVRAVFASGR